MSYLIDPQLEKVKILVEFATGKNSGLKKAVENIISEQSCSHIELPELYEGPFNSENDVEKAVIEAGKAIAGLGFAGTVFGNVSMLFNNKLLISSTGSRLESLENEIVPCDLSGKTLNGASPSSELPTHLRIVNETSSKCVLHAHPFYTIVFSMIKGENNTMFGVPVVGGEPGGGPKGIVQTVPEVLKQFNIAVVHAHGVFAVDAFDFNSPLKSIYKLEQLSRKIYVEKYLCI